MTLKINQDFDYQGDDWWKWCVWIDGPEEELDEIDHVVYTLHPTFPNPVRMVKNRPSKFRLVAIGWGVFRIYASVANKNGKSLNLYHDLDLKYPDGTSTTA